MKTLDYLKSNVLQLAMLLLIGLLFLERCRNGNNNQLQPTVTVTRDSVWIIHDSTVRTAPVLIETKTLPVEKWDTVYRPDTGYAGLLKQYYNAVSTLLASNYYRDSLRIDSLGTLYLNDTVSRNAITGRGYRYNFKYPRITETVTIREPYKPSRQLYIGGGVEGNRDELIHQFKTGLLYKDRKDRIFIFEAGADKQLKLSAELKTYWKLKF